MKVEQTRHVDASELDAEGMHRWSYEYDLYRFSEGERTLVARSYTDTSGEVHFLRIEVHGAPVHLTAKDLLDPLFTQASRYLRSIGKVSIRFLGPEGYVPVLAEA